MDNLGAGDSPTLNSQGWLAAIRDADDTTRVGLIEDFHASARPVVKRATATLLREYKVGRTTWADDVELLVTETLLSLVVDVVAGRDTIAQGTALYSVLLTRSRARFQSLMRGKAHEDSIRLGPMVTGLRALTSELHLDGPYTVMVRHMVSGDTEHIGPFNDVVEALRYSMRVESHLAERGDPEWVARPKPLIDPAKVTWMRPEDTVES